MRRTATEGYEARSVPVALKMEAGDLCIEIRINHKDMKARSRRGRPASYRTFADLFVFFTSEREHLSRLRGRILGIPSN